MELREINCEDRRWMEMTAFGISDVDYSGSVTKQLVGQLVNWSVSQ